MATTTYTIDYPTKLLNKLIESGLSYHEAWALVSSIEPKSLQKKLYLILNAQ